MVRRLKRTGRRLKATRGQSRGNWNGGSKALQELEYEISIVQLILGNEFAGGRFQVFGL